MDWLCFLSIERQTSLFAGVDRRRWIRGLFRIPGIPCSRRTLKWSFESCKHSCVICSGSQFNFQAVCQRRWVIISLENDILDLYANSVLHARWDLVKRLIEPATFEVAWIKWVKLAKQSMHPLLWIAEIAFMCRESEAWFGRSKDFVIISSWGNWGNETLEKNPAKQNWPEPEPGNLGPISGET